MCQYRENSASEDELGSEEDGTGTEEKLLPGGANDRQRMSSQPAEGKYTILLYSRYNP